MEQQQIDELLQRYLGLLDEYTQLRQRLSQLQSGIYQNIARANFSGERGMRYGQDHYDERMQATRILTIQQNEDHDLVFAVVDSPQEDQEAEKKVEKDEDLPTEESGDSTKSGADGEKPVEKKRKNKNPLRWFGLFAPMPLRTAQTQSVQAVQDIIPRLVSVNAEMLNVEIEVRRARKRRAKTEAAERKTSQTAPSNQLQSTILETS